MQMIGSEWENKWMKAKRFFDNFFSLNSWQNGSKFVKKFLISNFLLSLLANGHFQKMVNLKMKGLWKIEKEIFNFFSFQPSISINIEYRIMIQDDDDDVKIIVDFERPK